MLATMDDVSFMAAIIGRALNTSFPGISLGREFEEHVHLLYSDMIGVMRDTLVHEIEATPSVSRQTSLSLSSSTVSGCRLGVEQEGNQTESSHNAPLASSYSEAESILCPASSLFDIGTSSGHYAGTRRLGEVVTALRKLQAEGQQQISSSQMATSSSVTVAGLGQKRPRPSEFV